jgi:ATP-dependent Clp protease ATP-binding subunit ClpA
MHKKYYSFAKESIKNYFDAVFNLIVFLPYFFSILVLVKTLFSPWKNLIKIKTKKGFDFAEWLERAGFNNISRIIGFWMRLSVILFYFLLQLIFLILLPVLTISYFIFLPLLYLWYKFEHTEETKKENSRINFIGSHLLKQENYSEVLQWFEASYNNKLNEVKWWKLNNLFTIPPLGRDWNQGYTPILDNYCIDLTDQEYQNKFKNLVDREHELSQIERILIKNEEPDVLIVGEEGVGKHTIVDALAKKIYEGKANPLLMYKRVLKLNMEKILNEFIDQKQRENFLETLLSEANEAKNVIILIDDFDRYVSVGEGRIDLSVSLEKFAKNNSLQLIGITTPSYYEKYIFANQKIVRYFENVEVFEVTKEQAVSILKQVTPILEYRYNLTVAYETIKNTIEKSDYFITTIPFPEKAIELLDSACAYTKDYLIQQKGNVETIITPDVVDLVLSEKTHVPTSLSNDLRGRLLRIQSSLTSAIVSQKAAVDQLSSAIRRSFMMIGRRKKPLATFLFLGPTGVGKTETAKTIARIFFESEKAMIRFDMSLYQTKEDIQNLVGSLNSPNPGLLTEAVRTHPYGVLLLDEFEKANKDLINIFLTVLDEGYFTDGTGKKVDCKNLVVIATSNAASDQLFQNPNQSQNNLINYLVSQKIFSPELLNRFDGIILYESLSKDAIVQIAKKMVDEISENIYKIHKIYLKVTPEYLATLADKGFDPKFGARNMGRIIGTEIEDKVAKIILENKIKENETINL